MAEKDNTKDVVNEEETGQQSSENTDRSSKNKSDDKKASAKKDTKKKVKKKALTKIEKKELELEELGYKMSDINDKYMRLSAEFDNYRKRTLKEKAELIKTAGGTVLADILPVVDDFERAMQSMEKTDDVSAMKDGVNLIYNKFKDFIKSKGIVEIEALHQEFDTDYHEALTKIPAPDKKLKGKVVDVIQKGYKIEEKVIRYSQVVVGE